MSIDFIFRILGMFVFAFLGWSIGEALGSETANDFRYILVLVLAGAALGLLITPWVTLRPYAWFRRKMRQVPASQLVAVTLGLLIGLIIAALTSLPLSLLPEPWGKVLPFVALVVFGYVGAWVMMMRERDIFNLFGMRFGREGREAPALAEAAPGPITLSCSIRASSSTGVSPTSREQALSRG